jgi:hypothetical protein
MTKVENIGDTSIHPSDYEEFMKDFAKEEERRGE